MIKEINRNLFLQYWINADGINDEHRIYNSVFNRLIEQFNHYDTDEDQILYLQLLCLKSDKDTVIKGLNEILNFYKSELIEEYEKCSFINSIIETVTKF